MPRSQQASATGRSPSPDADADVQWSGTLHLGDGYALYAGPLGPTELHAHHAFQIVWAKGASIHDAAGARREGNTAVIPPNTRHALADYCSVAFVLHIDPDTVEGRRMRTSTAGGDRRGFLVLAWGRTP